MLPTSEYGTYSWADSTDTALETGTYSVIFTPNADTEYDWSVVETYDATTGTINLALALTVTTTEVTVEVTAEDVDTSVTVGSTFAQGYLTYQVTKVATSDSYGELTVTGVTTKGAAASKLTVAKTITTSNGKYTYRITAIADNAFKGHKNLTKISIGVYVKTIGKNAFKNCKKLKNVTLKSGLETIGNSAFQGCKKLVKVTIPKNVTKIGKKAFYGCKSLKSITIKSKKLTKKNVGKKAFKGIKKTCTIKLPKKKKAAYKKILLARGVKKTAKFK